MYQEISLAKQGTHDWATMKRLDVGRNFFSIRTDKQWLPREVVQSPSLEFVRFQVEETLSNLDLRPHPALSRGLD